MYMRFIDYNSKLILLLPWDVATLEVHYRVSSKHTCREGGASVYVLRKSNTFREYHLKLAIHSLYGMYTFWVSKLLVGRLLGV